MPKTNWAHAHGRFGEQPKGVTRWCGTVRIGFGVGAARRVRCPSRWSDRLRPQPPCVSTNSDLPRVVAFLDVNTLANPFTRRVLCGGLRHHVEFRLFLYYSKPEAWTLPYAAHSSRASPHNRSARCWADGGRTPSGLTVSAIAEAISETTATT